MPYISRIALEDLKFRASFADRRINDVSKIEFDMVVRQRDAYRDEVERVGKINNMRQERIRMLEICNGDPIAAREAMEFADNG